MKDIAISVGSSVLEPEKYDIADAISRVDAAMYKAKRKGRNQVCFQKYDI